jgi:tRNA (5-methylaminomethyl-2-thiouridylate)-methyltransferase
LDQKQVSKLIFPIGHLNKTQVRELAQKYDLSNKDRKDSQGICFLGKFKFDDFLKYYVGVKKGDLIEFETGKKLGEHDGFWFHTIGQRRGSGLSGGPWYVVEKDVEKNIVYLSKNYYSQEKVRDTFEVEKVNWISGVAPVQRELQVKMRHGRHRSSCVIDICENGNLIVKLASSDQGIAPGQFAVFYLGDICLGGGVIKGACRKACSM